MAKATTEKSARRRLLWFLFLWAGGVVAVSLIGFGIRLIMNGVYG